MADSGFSVKAADRAALLFGRPDARGVTLKYPTSTRKGPTFTRKRQTPRELPAVILTPSIREVTEVTEDSGSRSLSTSSRGSLPSVGSSFPSVTSALTADTGLVTTWNTKQTESDVTLNPYVPLPRLDLDMTNRRDSLSVPASPRSSGRKKRSSWPGPIMTSSSRRESSDNSSSPNSGRKQGDPVVRHLRKLLSGAPSVYSPALASTRLYEREARFLRDVSKRRWSLDAGRAPEPEEGYTGHDTPVGFYRHKITSLFLPLPTLLKVKKRRRKRSQFPKIVIRPLLRFRRVAKTIVTLLKATTASRQGDQTRTEKKLLSFTQFKDELLNTQRKFYGTDLSFDPITFRAHRESTVSNEAKAILSLEQRDRTEDQLHVALLSLQQAVESFGEFPIGMQQSLVKVGWYEHFESKRVIIRQGHTADNFYFILSGTAVVTILETSKAGESYVRTAATLGKGNSFGELALMHGAKRSATVTCKDDVELLAVGREDFIDIFMKVEKDREPEHIRYLRCIELLQGWPIERLPTTDPKICLFTYFRRGVVMCRDSNTSDWLYIIKTGSCRVLKKLVSAKPNLPGLEQQDYHPVTLETKVKGITPRSPRKSDSKSEDRQTSPNSTPRKNIDKKDSRERRKKSDEEVRDEQAEHLQQIEEIYREKHDPVRLQQRARQKQQKQRETQPAEIVFVQAQKLGPKDTFGFEHVAFSMMQKCTSVSLVSDGAEAVLINKKFFLQHLNDEVRKQLRCTVQPYPTEEDMQQKLQDKTNWEAFKTMTVNSHVGYQKQVQDSSLP